MRGYRAIALMLAGVLGMTMEGFAQNADNIHGADGIVLPPPPATKIVPVTDNYFGTTITDNYRWLEDQKAPQTRAWLEEQNAYTKRYLDQVKIRGKAIEELTSLRRVTTWGAPTQRGDNYFFSKRFAEEEQASIYVRHGWTGKDERLVDPAKLSRDPNTSVGIADISEDGSLLAYSVRQGGADEGEVHFFDVKNNKTLEDLLPSDRYFGIDLAPNGKGIYYSRFTHQGTLVYYHAFGTSSTSDKLLLGHEFRGEQLGEMDLISTRITEDGRYLMLEISRGVPAKRVDIVFRDLEKPDSPFEVLIWGFEARFSPLYDKGDWYMETDYHAPKGRIVKIDPGHAPESWKTIVPEGKDVIDGSSIVGGKLYVSHLKDVQSETSIYSMSGKYEGNIHYEGIGQASGIFGRAKDRYGFYSFQSFITPPTIYRYDTVTGKHEVFAQPKIPFDSSQYELKQVFYTSKDGTKIPMFIAGKKGLKTDGTERLLMTGYGGFNISLTPTWNPQYAWWLEQGGWFALPNLRGGGEYGEQWHKSGMFEQKQNVFDDWFAAAEYLIANHYTDPKHFAITGRSNGGLLMGASMTERPDLFGAILCGYPLLDMLRYQKFLFGRLWTTEYGSAENAKDFPYIVKYSPYQNIHAGVKYPAILFFTGDSDTRVDPLHARKMTAAMQAASASERPVMLHYNLKAGHSAGVSVEQAIEDDADQLSFLWTESDGK